jgi:carboxypeptidase C (cathepsin A)
MTDPQDNNSKNASSPPVIAPKEPAERIVTTEHRLVVGKKALDYTATCGTVLLRDYDNRADASGASAATGKPDGKRTGDKAQAEMFFVAYTLKGVKKAEARPVTFSFNGGPGSSSVWLHLGLLGPQRVVTDEMGRPPAPPYALTDNDHTLLTDSDLVFIDPVGTGHSRMLEAQPVTEFHEFQRDLDAVGEFIRLYLTRHGRWGSPKYLIGESYGTTRACGLCAQLQRKHDIFLNGVMLVSLAVDLQTLSFDHGNELPYPLFLPTYAATAWYHKALAADLQKLPLRDVVAAAEKFALNDYTVALMQGSRLAAAERERIAAQVARWSGLSTDYVLKCDLRPTEFRYFKELLRQRGQTVGRLDARFTGVDRDDAGEKPDTDAAMDSLTGAYASAINRLLKDTLKFDSDAPYVMLASIWDQWKWKDFENKYVNVGASLRAALQANPHMRVYVASGYYDLATPHAAGDYTLSHLGLREQQPLNISVSYFEAGHMMYIHRPSLVRMAKELRAFVGA